MRRQIILSLKCVVTFLMVAWWSNIQANPCFVGEKASDTLVQPAAIPDTAAGQGEVFYVVEVMPNFIFGDRQGIEAFRNYVAMNLVYPADAQMNGIQGKVFVSFIVEVDGSVSNVKLVRSVNKLLDDVAIGAISASPRWKPGMHKGKPVRVNLTFPVNFKL